ncbi:aldehyde dehydrogenase family protein [Caulobacter sp.]|uniref:aldehyde dehydrogenase family protein n=1 Tax=Caulobacter sp. TaxID=78 RepID=UPI002B46F5F6|nr:aldehyde dehydrogenase family protein [Caulobacter sp.]HJV41558.1 aldehyde dehydrogenase family protein [Caulobacter sp.]
MSRASRLKQLIDGAWVEGEGANFVVVDKFLGEEIAEGREASADQVRAAIAAARRSFETVRLEPYERYRLLSRVADLILANREELTGTIIAESGVPWKDSDNEVARTAETFRTSAEEAKRLVGEMVPIQGAAGQSHRMAMTIRVPRGVVAGISAFNSPLNMVAHKAAPALAAGNTVVVKPPPATPLSGVRLFELMLEAGFPPGHVNLVLGGAEVGRALVEHDDIDFVTFTGSTPVGKAIRQSRGMRPVALELGSIAATIVCADADLDRAAVRCAQSGFRRQGQACTSTQRLFIQRPILERFTDMVAAETKKLKVGDPRQRDTDVGPLISEKDAIRAEAWVREAIAQGARLINGGQREGAVLQPTILADVPKTARVLCEEIFAPVLSIIPFDDLDAAIDEVNATEFGLAAGLFTRDIERALKGAARIHVGVVHLNDASSSRVDVIPFGGVKDSGVGVEGPRYAMREMTEERLVTITL